MKLRERNTIYPKLHEKFVELTIEGSNEMKKNLCKKLMECDDILYAELHPLEYTGIRIVVSKAMNFVELLHMVKREIDYGTRFVELREVSSFYPALER